MNWTVCNKLYVSIYIYISAENTAKHLIQVFKQNGFKITIESGFFQTDIKMYPLTYFKLKSPTSQQTKLTNFIRKQQFQSTTTSTKTTTSNNKQMTHKTF